MEERKTRRVRLVVLSRGGHGVWCHTRQRARHIDELRKTVLFPAAMAALQELSFGANAMWICLNTAHNCVILGRCGRSQKSSASSR